jgi:hypothetical protein
MGSPFPAQTGHGLPSGILPWFLHHSRTGSCSGIFGSAMRKIINLPAKLVTVPECLRPALSQ